MLKSPSKKGLLDGDNVASGEPTDGNTLAVGETAVAQNGLMVTSTDLSGDTGTSQPSLTVNPALTIVTGAAQPPLTGNSAPTLTVADGASAEIDGASAQSVTFAGTTGTLELDDALSYTGQVSGLVGSDAIDLADISYGTDTRATFLGDANGGTLTITDGTRTANIGLVGNYLSSSWDLTSDGHGGTLVVDPTWQTLKVGAGGWVTGIDIAPDGTMVVRTDTYGAYIWNGTQWQQLVTAASMPAAFTTQNQLAPMFGQQGVYEIQIAPSNSSILYMMYDGYVFQSTNKGTTWTETSFAQVTDGANDSYRMDGQRMAIDPNNPNVVYVGTPESGLFVTTNGGVTWQSVSAVPASPADSSGVYPGLTGILFDPAIGGTTGGKTNTIFASSYGNGVYESTNAGASWTHLTGGPSNVENAAVSSTGVYYAIGDSNTDFWSYANNTWTELLTPATVGGNGLQAVAIDPSNPSEIVVITQGGSLDISYNGGATWSGDNWNEQQVSTDIPWLDLAGTLNQFMSISGMEFSTTVPNELIVADGIGVWTTTIPTAGFTSQTPVVWNDQSAGIEQLVANDIVVPPGGDPVVASMDRSFFYIDNATAYPSTYGPIMNDVVSAGFSVDYASSDPSFLVGISEWWGVERSGYSTDGGQTWTAFPTFIPGASTAFMGGSIAASSPTDIIWAKSGGNDPYYTLNGGQTWSAITLPGVSNWSSFDTAWYLDTRTVTADRVLPNTFYLYYGGVGVFESTNGGATWTKVFNGSISPDPNFDSQIQSVPGEAGNLFYTDGPIGGSQPDGVGFYRSTNQGATWTAVANVQDVSCFGYGAAAPGQTYPTIYIVGYVNNTYGIWQSSNNAQSWTQIGTYPSNSLDEITTISGDPNNYGQVYVGFAGSGYDVLLNPPSVTGVAATPATGDKTTGQVVTLTLNMTAVVTVTGTPTLSLNDGGTATYTGGSGTNALTFSYTVAAGQSTSALAITAANLPNGATITDDTSTSAVLTGAVTSFPGLQIGSTSTGPTVSSIVELPSSGDLDAGKTVTLTLNMSGNVTVNTTGGRPTLTLNDGTTATYTSGTGTSALVFTYTVAAGQNTASLAATAVNLNGAAITDGSGNAANVSLTGLTQTGPQIDTSAPTISSLTDSPSSGDFDAGKVITLTLGMSSNVTVDTTGGSPTLTLNDGGTATYVSGSGSNALVFSYTVAAGQNTPDLTVSTVNLNGATLLDGAGNVANLSLAEVTQGSPQIDTTAPTVSAVTTSGTGITAGAGDLTTGSVVTLTVNLSETVTVNTTGGTPTLTLNDGGTATYTGGTGTNALTFSYTVAAGQNTADLAVTAVNLNSATVTDGAGNAANLAGAVSNPAGTLQIDTTTPTVSSVTTSGTGITAGAGDLTTGAVVTFTVAMSEVVTVNTTGGTPTLTLNDGGIATYTGGTGTNALTFSYTVAAGQNTADLAVTAVNLNSATIKDGAGNAANLTGAVTNPAGTLQIDTTTPTVSSVATSGTGITAGAGDLTTGSVVTLTVNLSETVTVNTTGGTPTLTLNDGGIATYTGGTGTNALTFSYTVAAGQNTADLAVTAVNLNSATVTDGAGNAANLSGAVTNPVGTLQIDTTAPVISAIAESPSSGDLDAGKIVTYTISLSEAVTVNTAGGSPTLKFNDGGTGTYVGGSGTNTLTFSYTVLPGQNTSDLTVSAVDLNGAAIQDSAGNAANLSVTGVAQGSPVIDTTPPTVASVTATADDYNLGNTLTLTLNMSEAVNVTGTPTLTLNDGGSATYVGGSGTNALTFTYTVAAGQNTAGLAVTAVNGTIADLAGNALSSTGLPETFAGVIIDTATPTVLSVATSGTGITAGAGDLTTDAVVTLTVNLSEAVTVDTTNGTPTLTLNDGGIATYVSGTGTSALTFSYTVAAGQNTADLAITAVNLNAATVTDGTGNAANLAGAVTNPAGTLQIDTTTPTINSIADSPATGDFNAGKVITLTLGMSEVVTVNTTGGSPTLTLNDGGIATYVSGSGTNALTFSYTVVAGQNTPDLTVSAANLNGATVQDGAGNAASLSLTGLTQGSPQIDTTTPVISAIVESPSSSDLNAGKTVMLTLDMSEVVTVNTTGGTPTLTLNDGGVATYVSGTGTNALTFSYTVATGQNTAALKATVFNLNNATITDGAGNAASPSLTGLTQTGPQIDTTTPLISAIVESPSSGDLNAGKTVTLTLDMSEVMTVNTTGGTPTLTLNDGGVATYVSGTGTNALTFSYTVAAGQNTAGLKATALSLNGATIADGAGNAANPSLTGLTQTGPQIDTTTPVISAIVESPSSGDLNAGKTVTLTLDMSEVMTVNTTAGAPTLTLNDGGIATYVSGTGTNALTFSYTVVAGQNTAALKATALNLNSATITDGAGNAANLSLTGLTQTGPQIDTTAPAAPLISYDKVIGNRALVVGTATAGSVVSIYEGTTLVGTTSSNSKGNWVFESNPLPKGTHTFTATATDTAGNVSTPSIAFDPDVGAGPVINAAAVEVGNQYYLYNSSGSDVALTYAGAIVTAGEFGGWTPIAAVQTATGYDVAWQMTGTNEYTVWATDSSGNTVANLTGPVSGSSYALESLESTFNQDLNGDGVIGVPPTEIQVVANQYYLDGISGSGPALQLGGAGVTVGELAGWTAIGAVQTATGYDVAWKMTGANEYTVWATNSSGNAIANLTGPVSGTSYALESLESTFNQDLNGDGVIGLTTTVIQVDGSTSLTEVANQFYLEGIGGSGPALQYAGADVTAGEFGGWTPIGAVQTATGYDVAWKMAGANEYTVWATDSSGNTVANLTGPVSGTSYALESLESTFNQDLNGDGVIGLYAAPGTAMQISTAISGPATIGTGATLELTGADSGSVTFASSKGTLVLDQSSTFSGQIIGFTGDGTLSGSDQIDMKDINFNTVQVSYTNGVLTVTDGVDTANLNFSGSYVMANFSLASDGSGGTIVYDPPVSNFGPGSGTAADSDSPSGTGPAAFGSTAGADTPPAVDTPPADPTGFGSPPVTEPPAADPQNPVGFGSSVGADTPAADPHNSIGLASAAVTDGASGGMHNSHGYGGSTVIDPPMAGAANQSNDSGSPSGSDPTGFGSPPAPEPPPVTLQNTIGFGSPPASDPPPVNPQNPTGFGFMSDPQNGTNGLAMPTFGAAATLGYFDNGIAEGTVLATNGAQGANIALLGNYMASSFPAPTGSLAGTTQGADGGAIGNSSSLLTHPQHA